MTNHALAFGIPFFLAIGIAGCGDSGDVIAQSDDAGGYVPDGGAGSDASDSSVGPETSTIIDSSVEKAGCEFDKECNGGVCVGGECCADSSKLCGAKCCGAAESCFANACVIPGKNCHSTADCDQGQYCEPSLADKLPDAGADAAVDAGKDAGKDAASDAGKDAGKDAGSDSGKVDATAEGGASDGGTDAGSQSCLNANTRPGKCLALPPSCDTADGGAGDAGQSSDGGVCIENCEYQPKVAALKPVEKWSWGPIAEKYPEFTDLWSTPLIGRVTDTNCDGKVDVLDPPNVIFVSGNAKGTCCHCTGDAVSACHNGVLRVLDGASGKEVWSLRRASAGSDGFMGLTNAIGDVDKDGRIDIVAVTSEGFIVLIDSTGKVTRTSDKKLPGTDADAFGWGGGLALADMDGDGFSEIAFGSSVFTTKGGKIAFMFTGDGGTGSSSGVGTSTALSTFVDLDGAADGHLELLAGRTAYKLDGTKLWNRSDIPDGFSGVGDFNKDMKPDAVLVANGKLYILNGIDGTAFLPPFTLEGTGDGGAPTVADFDGDHQVEIGVAQANFYSVIKPDIANKQLKTLWKTENHDLSSSVTGSSVFDFEGDGKAEVIYGDECFLWVYNGANGKVRFATPHTSFTGTEASLVADIDGDGRAEILMVSNGADPESTGWKCNVDPWNKADPVLGRPAWKAPAGAKAYRGITVFGDKSNGWVGTRTLWNQHTYHVTNICDDRDSACLAPNLYGSIPQKEQKNWELPWLNNFRQNVQDKGLFDAPDATALLKVNCTSPLQLEASVRNLGSAILPAGVTLGLYLRVSGTDTLITTLTSASALFPGQAETLVYDLKAGDPGTSKDVFVAKILIDPLNETFHECREGNNNSDEAKASCSQVN